MFFWDFHIITITLSCEFRGHRAGSQLKMVGRLPATAVHSITTMSEIRRYIDLLTTLITDQASCTWDNHNKSFFLCNEWSSENKTWGLFKLLLIEAIVQSNRDFFSSHISSYVQRKTILLYSVPLPCTSWQFVFNTVYKQSQIGLYRYLAPLEIRKIPLKVTPPFFYLQGCQRLEMFKKWGGTMDSKIPYSHIPPGNILGGLWTRNMVINIPPRGGLWIANLLTSHPQKGGSMNNPTL